MQSDTSKNIELVRAILSFNRKGWSEATSTNYSYRLNENHLVISKSGVDKEYFSESDLLVMTNSGEVLHPKNTKSSAETEIHLELYKTPSIQCVLHTHSPYGTYLSDHFFKEKKIYFSNLEIIKGISGHDTHLTTLEIPIFDNSQDMKDIISEMNQYTKSPPQYYAFLIRGHGLYAWGKSIAEAKRHIETCEFLFYQNLLSRRDHGSSL
jgi:methylthioribulose-1-phosphate dehydratase